MAKIDAFGNTLLHIHAADHPRTLHKHEIVRLLLARGCPADAKNNIGRTPLHGAIWAGDAVAVDMLAGSCDLWRTMDDEGVTPIDMALERDDPDVIEVLKRHVRARSVTTILSLYRRGVDYQCAVMIARHAFEDAFFGFECV